MRARILPVAVFFFLSLSAAFAQPATVLGPIVPGNIPEFNSTTVIKDSGIPASSLTTCPTLGAFIVGTGSGVQCSTVAGSTAVLNGSMSINPTTGTTNRGLTITQTAPSSGTPVGPVLFNQIDVTNPGLGASGGGLDNFGGQNILYGLRATMSVTGASSGAGSAALGGFTNLRAASDGFGGALGVTVTGTGPSGHNSWGGIGYGIVFNGGAIGLIVGLEGEAAVVAGATASIRVGISSNSQGPVQGSVLDAAFAANTINIGAAGGNAAPWQHLMALSGNMYTGIGMPLAATGDFFFSDTAGTVAHFANLSNITVTGNILAFPNVVIAGNGGAVFGSGGTPTAGQLIDTCTSCGRSLTSTSTNSTSGSDGTAYTDSSGNNVLFAGVGEAANNTVTRFGQPVGNFGLLFTNSSTNLGLLLGTVTNVPLIVGTNNTARMTISGAGSVTFSGQIVSSVSTGTAPLSVASTTNVANLNASSLGGATFASPGAIGVTTAGTGAFTTLTAGTSITSPVHSAPGTLQFASNGGTIAGAINTSEQWFLGTTLSAPASGVELTVSNNAAAPAAAPAAGTIADFISADGVASRLAIRDFGAGTAGPAVIYYAAGGTAAAPTGTLSGNAIGVNFGFGYGTGAYRTAAGSGFQMLALENCSSTACGSDFEILTTPITTATQSVMAYFRKGLSIGTSSADEGAGTVNAATGFYTNGTQGVSKTCGATIVASGGIITSC